MDFAQQYENPEKLQITTLVRAAQDGQRAAFDELYRRYQRAVCATIYRRLGNDAEAQDVVQETVLSVSKSMPDFHYDAAHGSFKSWLLRLTGWRIVDQIRKRPPEARRPELDPGTSTGTDAIDRILRGELQGLLRC